MVRLIVFILYCAISLVFIVFNLDNKSDVSFGFKTFEGIPVFLTAFSSFVLGMLFAVPFVLSFCRRKKKSNETDSSPSSGGKKRWGWKKNKNTPETTPESGEGASSLPAETKKEDGSYGID